MSTYLIWFLIGAVFIIAEFIMPTFIMFFFAIGAILVSAITAFSDITINSQIILFAIFSVLSLLLLRSYVKNIFRGFQFRGEDKYSHNTNDTDGSIAIVSKPVIENGFGEIKYKGTYFKAQADAHIPKDQMVKVIGKGDEQGSFLIVEQINK